MTTGEQSGGDVMYLKKIKNEDSFEELNAAKLNRGQHALCNFRDILIFATGGAEIIQGNTYGATTCQVWSVYDLKWHHIQELNEGRFNHASCAMDDYIFVFGGNPKILNLTNSIERLLVAGPNAKTEQWSLIQLPEHLFRPRNFMACCALNSVEIVILGGYFERVNGSKDCSDVLIYNIRTNKVQKMNKVQHPENFSFQQSYSTNNCIQVRENKVVAIVRGKYEGVVDRTMGQPYLIEYTRGSDSVKVIEKIETPEPFEN